MKRIHHETGTEEGMDQNELDKAHDDFPLEITNLPQDDEEGSAKTPRFFMATWLRSPRYRKQQTIAIALGLGLALLIVLFVLAIGANALIGSLSLGRGKTKGGS